MNLEYKKYFNPVNNVGLHKQQKGSQSFADRSSHVDYVYTDEIILAVNVALATGRPLLVRGPSGSGKSSLARSVANHQGWRYVETIVTSRTQARDLMWQVDLLKRLQDAQAKQLGHDWEPYVNPGVLWWAFDSISARSHLESRGSGSIPVNIKMKFPDGTDARTVLLIDEIDKADPDVPNNLLKPIGELAFEVEEIGLMVEARIPPLVFITTNEERDLPPAFLRRCVELNIPPFDRERLFKIGMSHFNNASTELLKTVADVFMNYFSEHRAVGDVNAAEYIDMVRACLELSIDHKSAFLKDLVKITLYQKK